MGTSHILLVSHILLLVATSTSSASESSFPNMEPDILNSTMAAPAQLSVEYFVFAIQWEPTVKKWGSTKKERFTIHGLFPSSSRGVPEFCGTNYDETQVKSIEAELHKNYPDLENIGGDAKFWKTQWLKHGTCSGLTELQFFQRCLTLFKELEVHLKDFLKVLPPGVEHRPAEMLRLYTTSTGEPLPKIVCSGVFIKELRIRFNLGFVAQPINAGSNIKDCPPVESISLPKGT